VNIFNWHCFKFTFFFGGGLFGAKCDSFLLLGREKAMTEERDVEKLRGRNGRAVGARCRGE
jgi:hypothetical protein